MSDPNTILEIGSGAVGFGASVTAHKWVPSMFRLIFRNGTTENGARCQAPEMGEQLKEIVTKLDHITEKMVEAVTLLRK